jgi:hypothetical protein
MSDDRVSRSKTIDPSGRPIDTADRIDRPNVVERAAERLERGAERVAQRVENAPPALFADAELTGYRSRWSGIQTGFVDEPRRAVEQADALVSELMTRLTETFTNERRNLEAQWEKSEKASTEDLRLAMQRYRSFFERLLNI